MKMLYEKETILKNGKKCILRNAVPEDAGIFCEYFIQAHSETEYLTTYPDESVMDAKKEADFLQNQLESQTNIEICAFVDGKLVGSAGNNMLSQRDKLRHRAEFGISILKEYWGMGIGKALTEACIECARTAGFLQLELEVVADNEKAVSLYKKLGFIEYGVNPIGFRKRNGEFQELILMRLILDSCEEECNG